MAEMKKKKIEKKTNKNLNILQKKGGKYIKKKFVFRSFKIKTTQME